jgi:hypothetical protein
VRFEQKAPVEAGPLPMDFYRMKGKNTASGLMKRATAHNLQNKAFDMQYLSHDRKGQTP